MYLHLGQDTLARDREIVGIFDLDGTTVRRDTRDFLQKNERVGRAVTVSTELPKSFVVCCEETRKRKLRQKEYARPEAKIYISQLAPVTLKKRAEEEI